MDENKLVQRNIDKLSMPFSEKDVEWTITHTYPKNPKSIKEYNMYCAPYINREAKILRLNRVLGIGNWQVDIRPLGGKGMLSGIAVRSERGDWSWYWDGAEYNADDRDFIDSVKAVNSQAFKRSTEMLGIGLYLKKFSARAYLHEKWKPNATKIQQNKVPSSLPSPLYWTPPSIPEHLLPSICTPEQYDYLRRYVKCLSIESLSEELEGIVYKYDANNESIPYNTTCDLIRRIEDMQKKGPQPDTSAGTNRSSVKTSKDNKVPYTNKNLMPNDIKEKQWDKFIYLIQSISEMNTPTPKEVEEAKKLIHKGTLTTKRVLDATTFFEKLKKDLQGVPF